MQGSEFFEASTPKDAEKKTELYITLFSRFENPSEGKRTKVHERTFEPCSSEKEFEEFYNDLKNAIASSSNLNIKFKLKEIKITGNLFGDNIKVIFNDLNSFYNFLVENSLITKQDNNPIPAPTIQPPQPGKI